MTTARYNMSELKKMYPDQWVILDDVEWENKSTIKGGVLVGVCSDDEISSIRMKYRHEGKKYQYRRTSEGILPSYIHAVNFEVTT